MNKFLAASVVFLLANVITMAIVSPVNPKLVNLLGPEIYQTHHVWIVLVLAGSFTASIVSTFLAFLVKGGVYRVTAVTVVVIFMVWMIYHTSTLPPC